MSADQLSAGPPPAAPRCPSCGAEQFSTTPGSCWLCQIKMPRPSTAEQADADRRLAERIRLPERRGDDPAWIFLGILAILVTIGLASAGPGILIVLLVLAVPALIRAAVAASHQAARGRPPTGLGVASAFLSSVGIVAMVGLASFVAFYATCWVVCLGGMAVSELNRGGGSYDWVLVASVGAGLVPGLWVAYKLFKRLWPQRG